MQTQAAIQAQRLDIGAERLVHQACLESRGFCFFQSRFGIVCHRVRLVGGTYHPCFYPKVQFQLFCR